MCDYLVLVYVDFTLPRFGQSRRSPGLLAVPCSPWVWPGRINFCISFYMFIHVFIYIYIFIGRFFFVFFPPSNWQLLGVLCLFCLLCNQLKTETINKNIFKKVRRGSRVSIWKQSIHCKIYMMWRHQCHILSVWQREAKHKNTKFYHSGWKLLHIWYQYTSFCDVILCNVTGHISRSPTLSKQDLIGVNVASRIRSVVSNLSLVESRFDSFPRNTFLLAPTNFLEFAVAEFRAVIINVCSHIVNSHKKTHAFSLTHDYKSIVLQTNFYTQRLENDKYRWLKSSSIKKKDWCNSIQ